MTRYPLENEGFLSQAREAMVRESALVDMARRLELGRALIVKPGNDYLRSVESVLADAFEAVVGALYRDSDSLQVVRQTLARCGFFR
jgi:ribonuclease-3